MKIYTKNELLDELKKIRDKGWIKNARYGNVGGVGNTLEDLLGIEENNLPLANASEWELKCQRADTSALTTLFHMEPSPRAVRFVPKILLPKYGWKHELAGLKYSANEMSFRQTINGAGRTDRGFMIKVDRVNRKILVSFDYTYVDNRHKDWLNTVASRVGLAELNPQPYWGFDDLCHKAGTKLLNTLYIEADVKEIEGEEYYHYKKIMVLQGFNFENFVREIEKGNILVDFDARTGHNHGTKFRLRQNIFPNLYSVVEEV
ncbi:MAG TPA: nciI [Anaerolineaceae bacterium]|nr:nciI [Anaerolineaceae bacterium]